MSADKSIISCWHTLENNFTSERANGQTRGRWRGSLSITEEKGLPPGCFRREDDLRNAKKKKKNSISGRRRRHTCVWYAVCKYRPFACTSGFRLSRRLFTLLSSSLPCGVMRVYIIRNCIFVGNVLFRYNNISEIVSFLQTVCASPSRVRTHAVRRDRALYLRPSKNEKIVKSGCGCVRGGGETCTVISNRLYANTCTNISRTTRDWLMYSVRKTSTVEGVHAAGLANFQPEKVRGNPIFRKLNKDYVDGAGNTAFKKSDRYVWILRFNMFVQSWTHIIHPPWL